MGLYCGVRLYAEHGRVWIMWREVRGGPRRYESYADTPEGRQEAKAFAEGKADALATPKAPTAAAATLRELWMRYLAAMWTDDARDSHQAELHAALATVGVALGPGLPRRPHDAGDGGPIPGRV